MKKITSLGLAVVTLLFTSWVLFGDFLALPNVVFILPGRLGAPLWGLVAAFAIAVASCVLFPPLSGYVQQPLQPAAFMASALILVVLFVGIYVDILRRIEIRAFAADRVIQHSFFRSIREVPRDFQFYLHAAALKNCIPYAWSYREMEFYLLQPDVAVNVLPPD